MPEVTINLCSGQTIEPIPYPPTGPRGWQDEYCEWSVTRDPTGKITSVMFTCENPEYWLTLWNCDPNAVLAQYRSLVSPKVQLLDLALLGPDNAPLTDPTTGRWAYNPLNKWNRGPHTYADQGGAVHLTSSPNTLGAEFDLAAAATIPRVDGSIPPAPITQAAPLVCCARYGKIGRHSDPTIGQNVNALVNYSNIQGALATLTDPPGLYIQTPDFSTYQTPDGTDPSLFWTVVRGQTKQGSDPIDRILHATYEVPPEKGYAVGDISIGGDKIEFGGQIASTITMALLGTVFSGGGPNQQGVGCTTPKPDAQVVPFAQGMQDAGVYTAYRALETAQNELTLAIPILAFPVAQGSTVTNVAVPLNLGDPPAASAVSVTTTAAGVTVSVDSVVMISQIVTLIVTVTADAAAPLGDCGVSVTVSGMAASNQPALGLLTIAPPAASASKAAPRPVRTGGRA
jgi:hypothetical protein